MADRPVAPHAPQQSHALGSINRTPRTLKGEGRTDGEENKKNRGEGRERKKKPKRENRGENQPKQRRETPKTQH
jgi:hypothetical protein